MAEIGDLAFLVGTWSGEGRGAYPTIEGFSYGEELIVASTPKPFLALRQRTWSLDDDRPLHAEAGYLRAVPSGVELVLAHPTGVSEIATGSVSGNVVDVTTTDVGLTPTATSVTELRRRYEVDGDMLTYDLWMAAVGEPLTHHLRAELRRSS